MRHPFLRYSLPLLLSILLLTGCQTEPLSTQSTYYLKRPDGSSITYYLERNSTQKNADTLLIFLQGSDCDSVAYSTPTRKAFKLALPQADLLLVEKYDIDINYPPVPEDIGRTDCPASYHRHNTPTQRVNDLIQVLDELQRTRSYPRIVALGGSEGADVANMLNAQVGYLNAVISLNGDGDYLMDDIIYSMEVEKTPENTAELDHYIQEFKDFAQEILVSDPANFSEDFVYGNYGYVWWYDILHRSQAESLYHAHAPVLVVQGSGDRNINPNAAKEMLNQVRQNPDCARQINYMEYEGLDHSFTDANGENQSHKVVAEIQRWLSALEDH